MPDQIAIGGLMLVIGVVGLVIFGEPNIQKLQMKDIPIYIALGLIIAGGGMSMMSIDHPLMTYDKAKITKP